MVRVGRALPRMLRATPTHEERPDGARGRGDGAREAGGDHEDVAEDDPADGEHGHAREQAEVDEEERRRERPVGLLGGAGCVRGR